MNKKANLVGKLEINQLTSQMLWKEHKKYLSHKKITQNKFNWQYPDDDKMWKTLMLMPCTKRT